MARIKWWTYLLNDEGQIITGADVGIYLAGTDIPAKIYTSEEGLEVVETDWQLKTNMDGYCEFWIGDSSDPNGYPSTQKFKIAWDKPGMVNGWNDYISILPATIPVNLGDPSTVRDRTVSNTLAIGWEDHKDDDTYYVHGIRPVDLEDTSSTINKLVSNEYANEWEETKWVSWQYISTNTIAKANRAYFIDGSLNTVQLSLPEYPNVGDPVIIATINTTNDITINRNGNKLFGLEQNLTVTQEKSGFTLVFSGEDYGWAIVSQISGISPLDGDTIEIDFSPTYYTRNSSITEATEDYHLAAHLKGIDDEINSINTDISNLETDLSSHIDDYNSFSDVVNDHINNDSIHLGGESEGNVGAVYSYTQASNSTTWNINHNLGTQDLIFEVYDENGKRIVPETAEIVDDNNITLTFTTATKGKCIVGGVTLSDDEYSRVEWNGSLAGATRNAISDKFELVDTNVEFLSANVDENTADISNLESDVTWLSGEVDKNTDEITLNSANIITNSDNINVNSSDISNLESDVTWLSGEVDNTKYKYVNIPAKDFIDGDNPPNALETLSFSLSGGKSQIRKFSGVSNENVIVDFETNEDIVPENGIQYKVIGYISETQQLSGDGITFKVSSFPISHSESLSGEYLGNVENSLTGLNLNQYYRFETNWSENIYTDGLSNGDGVQVKFERNPINENDTYEHLIGVSYVKLRYSVNIL